MTPTLTRIARTVSLCAVVLAACAAAAQAAAQAVVDRACPNGTTMTVTAHADDSILFLSPDIVRDVERGRCLRSVVTTSGSHWDVAYMRQREAGMEAAYAEMAGMPDHWTYAHVREDRHWITEARLKGDRRLSIDFMRLPNNAYPVDGPDPSTGAPSLLSALERGWIPSLTTIDGPTAYTRTALVDVLALLMRRDQPDRIDTQDFVGHYGWGDHSDHRATAFLTRAAWRQYGQGTLVSYLGYSAGLRAPNVFGPILQDKIAAWDAYAPYDANVPQTDADLSSSVYKGWLPTQYRLVTLTMYRRHVQRRGTGRASAAQRPAPMAHAARERAALARWAP